MDVLLLALTIAPGLAIAIYIYYRDKFDREPLRQLVWAFVLGIFSTVPAIAFSFSLGKIKGLEGGVGEVDTLLYAFITVALAEETAKFIFLRRFYRKPFFNEPFDGITYAVMIGMGFATLENLLYVFLYEGGYRVALMRMLTAVPAHASFAIIMGYFVGLAKFKEGRHIELQIIGLVGAVAAHGLYDFLLMLQNYPYLAAGAIVSLGVSVWLSFKAIRIHLHNSPFNPRLF